MIIRKVKVTEYEYQAPINYVAGATEPDIQFQLTDYEIPSGATGRVYVGRSDGTFEYTVATISGNTVTVAPTSSMFSVRGAGAIQVTLYVGNEVVKNFAVPVYVHSDLADDSAHEGSDVTGVFQAAEEEALADFQEQAEEIVQHVIEEIPEDYTELTEEVEQLNERLDAEGLSENAKVALLNCFAHVAWIDEHGQDYYDALVIALSDRGSLVSISAVFDPEQNVVYDITPLEDLKQYLTVTGLYSNGTTGPIYDYSLSGKLVIGTTSVTVTKDDKTTSFNVTATYPYSSEGLMAYFDGINNTGNGHSASVTKWTDLINGYQLNFTETTHTTWGDDGVNLAGGEWSAQGLMSNGRLWTPATNATIEIVLECETAAKNQSIVVLDSENTSASGNRAHRHVCLYSDNTIGFISTSSNTYTNPETDFTSIKQIAAVYNGYTVNKAYINGSEASQSSASHSYRLGTPNEYIGYGDATNYNMSLKGKIHAVRVYNRNLTAEELAQNLAYDNQRFALGLEL